MRTLAATFDSREEAEAACRRLEAIGIARDRIILKDVASAAAGAGAAPGGGVFISLKVTNEQVEPVNDILKRQPGPSEAPAPADHAARPAVALHRPEQPGLPPRPLSPVGAEPGLGAAAGTAPPQPQPRARPDKLTPQDRARLGRNLILFCLVLVAAFMIGAWLGMLS